MKIVSIKEVAPRDVYAISTTTKTFIADGLAHHNCVGCNLFGDGKTLDFEDRLITELGAEKVAEMKAARHQTIILSTEWYKAEIARYKALLASL